MAPGTYNPRAELDGALERCDLRFAVTLAEELRIERRRPIDLDTAARFLPLIVRERPREFDAWALRWLARWLSETSTATTEQAAEVARARGTPAEPTHPATIRAACVANGGEWGIART
jgi:hypothetical protein